MLITAAKINIELGIRTRKICIEIVVVFAAEGMKESRYEGGKREEVEMLLLGWSVWSNDH